MSIGDVRSRIRCLRCLCGHFFCVLQNEDKKVIRTKIMEVFGSGDEEVARKRFNKMVDAAFLANSFLFVSKRKSEKYVWRRCVCGTSSERALAFGCSFIVFSVS